MCSGVIYDPCMCSDAPDCNFTFAADACATGVILMPPSSAFDMASLHWPRAAWPDSSAQELLDHVHHNQSVHGIPFVLDDEMIQYVLTQASKDEGGTPDAFCDDTLDYMHSEARHPVGYHPTCACTRAPVQPLPAARDARRVANRRAAHARTQAAGERVQQSTT